MYSPLKVAPGQDVVTHAFNHCTQEAEAGGFVKLPWPTTVSSSTARAMERGPVSKNQKEQLPPEPWGGAGLDSSCSVPPDLNAFLPRGLYTFLKPTPPMFACVL